MDNGQILVHAKTKAYAHQIQHNQSHAELMGARPEFAITYVNGDHLECVKTLQFAHLVQFKIRIAVTVEHSKEFANQTDNGMFMAHA